MTAPIQFRVTPMAFFFEASEYTREAAELWLENSHGGTVPDHKYQTMDGDAGEVHVFEMPTEKSDEFRGAGFVKVQGNVTLAFVHPNVDSEHPAADSGK